MKNSTLKKSDFSCILENNGLIDSVISNLHAECRMQSLNWERTDIEKKSVLDVGCSDGFCSLYASSLGASLVTAVENDAFTLEKLSKFSNKYQFPIVTHCAELDGLDRNLFSADIVVSMGYHNRKEASHTSIDDVIKVLAPLALDSLYFEFAWDRPEESVTNSDSESALALNLESAIRLFQTYFECVELTESHIPLKVGENKEKVVIIGRGKRSNWEILLQLPECNVLDISMKRGGNSVELLTTRNGAIVLKELPTESMISGLELESQIAMFDTFAESDGPLLAPMKFAGAYILLDTIGRQYMVFPFVGKYGDYYLEHVPHVAVQNPLGLAVDLRKTMKLLPRHVIEDVKRRSPPIRLKERAALGSAFNRRIAELELEDFFTSVFSTDCAANSDIEDSVIHNDLQRGNMIRDGLGKEWVIDMDILRSGTAYTDFICCAIYNNSPLSEIKVEYQRILKINQRAMSMADVYFAMRFILRWITVLNEHYPEALERLENPTLEGIDTISRFTSSISAANIC